MWSSSEMAEAEWARDTSASWAGWRWTGTFVVAYRTHASSELSVVIFSA